MIAGSVVVKGIVKILTTAVAKQVALNVLVVLGEWAVKQTTNDLDDRLFKPFKDAVDKRHGRATNLYREVR